MPRRARILDTLMLAAAGVFGIAALVVSARRPEPQVDLTIRLLAGTFWGLTGLAMGWAGWDRVGRERGRRRWFLLLTVGACVWLFGHALRYLVLPADSVTDPPAVALPWMLGLLSAMVALFGLAWPRDHDPEARLHMFADSALGIGALAVIWTQIVLPVWPERTNDHLVSTELTQWILFAGFSVLIVFVASGRQMGALPFPQLLLFLSGLTMVLVSATLREVFTDSAQDVTYAILGYWTSVCLMTAMLQRSSAEAETRRSTQARAILALLVPLTLVVVAGVVILDLAALAKPESRFLNFAPALWIMALIAVAVSGAVDMRMFQLNRHLGMSNQLSMSAERGWISALLRDSAEYLFVINLDGDVVFSSPRSQTALGPVQRLQQMLLEPDEQGLATILSGVTAQSLSAGPHEMRLMAADGTPRSVEMFLRPVQDVSFEGFVVSGSDVTHARSLAARLESTGRRDALTGLMTGEALRDELSHASQNLSKREGELAVAIFDLTDFGVWNDSHGRGIGDSILKAVAAALESLPDSVIAVARVGGDSFAILVRGQGAAQTTRWCLDTLSHRLQDVILPDNTDIKVGFRAGYAVQDRRNRSARAAGDLLEKADVALRRARLSKHSTVLEFRSGMNEDLIRRLAGVRLVRDALETDALVCFYQPIISLVDGRTRSVEALARIRAADGSIVGPSAFLAAAEHGGLIDDLDRAIRTIVARDWCTIAGATGSELRINVNIAEHEITEALAREISASGMAEHLTVEVTEATILSNLDAAQVALQSIRQAGSLVAIDDFGTGYSSLSQIASLPCDVVKIDRGFISAMLDDSKVMVLVRAMIQLGHDLGLGIVAEGVENPDQAAALRALGCEYAQGFLFARPLPLDELIAWLEARGSLPGPRQQSYPVPKV